PGAADPPDAPRLGVMTDRGNPALAAVLTVLLVALFFGLTINTFALNAFLQNPPNDPNALYIDVIGFQWGWRFVYANGRELIGELRVPVVNSTCTGAVRGCWSGTVILNITSQDVFHSFGIAVFKIKRDAIPGRVNQAWFVADKLGIPETIPEYHEAVTTHGLLMLLWVLTPLGAAFANYFVPIQIGARDMAFPRLNALSYWVYLASGLLALSSFFAGGGTADWGWTTYAPLNTVE